MLWLAVVCGGLVAGCSSKQCTLIGCGPSFEVRFIVGQDGWPPGTYNVTVTADGATGSCDVTLPFPSCQTSSMACTGIRDWDVEAGGCALPAEQHAIYGVVFWRTAPMNVELAVSRDGEELKEGAFTPIYQSSYPNGPGCGEPCYGAPASTMAIQL